MSMLTKTEAVELSVSIVKRAKSLNRDIQKIAMTCIGHLNVHGDITVLQTVYDNLKDVKGIKVKSLVKYIETYGKTSYNKDTKNFQHYALEGAITDPMALFLELGQNMWYDSIKEDPIASVHDLQDMISKMIAKVEKLAQQESVTVYHLDLLKDLKGIVAAKEGFDVEEDEAAE